VGRLGSESRYVDPDLIGEFILSDSQGPRSYPTFVQADNEALPFATESIDTFILPHMLEFVSDPHQVLREVERVLKPEGRLFILGLNPWCPRRLLQWTRRSTFWNASLIAGHHLLDWLSLLKFDAELEAAFSRTRKKGYRYAENTWDELKAGLSVAYAIKAIKRSYTLIPIESEWCRITQLVTGQLLDSPQITQRRKS
jgi:SAM-dependent methyltransferase